MKRLAFLAVIAIVCLIYSTPCRCEREGILSTSYKTGDFKLFDGGKAADVLTDAADARVVSLAASALADDIRMVAGVKPRTLTKPDGKTKYAIIIGTVEKNSLIKSLIKSKKLDATGINGKWETFVIATVDRPFGAAKAALVVAGSDRRGAAFGAFELSKQIGVSPWVWWADVKPEKRASLIVKKGKWIFGPPSVKYRGIFLNDEDFGLKPWAAKTFEPETGDIGPKTYAKIFELLLRLKANHIWPAMHNCTRAFNHYDKNKLVADDYAIVMGSSHCEQMLRNNVDEWDFKKYGDWSYVNNKSNLLRYWDERVSANAPFENIYTIGMRAIHDSGMPDGKSVGEKVAILDSIIADQRKMLAEHVNKDVTKVPQVFIPYKEVLQIYWGGLKVPDDVTLVWPDDNFGYIRRLSTPEEAKRSGGSGVYYHISYWGPPHDYLWLNTTPPALLWEEMNKAWAFNARTLWMLNVGDIKPHEIGMELFLQMGWDIKRWNEKNIGRFLVEWARREFGTNASEIADIMSRYYLLNTHRKPEHMGFYDKYSLLAQNQDPEFSLYQYGDEAQKRIDAFDEIEKRAETVYEKMSPDKKDAYYQLVLYPVRTSSLLNKKHLYAYKSRRYVKQGRASVTDYARKSEEALAKLHEDTFYYNTKMSGGKWKGMMDDSPNDLPVFDAVKTGKTKTKENAVLGVAVEGSPQAMAPDGKASGASEASSSLPSFNCHTRKKYFIDIFNEGDKPFEWQAVPSASWILLSKTGGAVTYDERIYANIDCENAPKGQNITGGIVISGAGSSYTVEVRVINPPEKVERGDYVQDNGVVSINAGDFSEYKDVSGAGWRVINGLGRTGTAIAVIPPTAPNTDDLKAAADSAPSVEYYIYINNPGEAEFILEALPTHEIFSGRKLRIGLSIDDAAIMPVDFVQAIEEIEDIGKVNVQRNMMSGKTKLKMETGRHRLRIWGLDAGVILDKILIDFGGLKKSYLGPEPTRVLPVGR